MEDRPANASIAPVLLRWYDAHARSFPWRVPPSTAAQADPYRVWLSEIMLQQTTTAAVIPYFARFLERWPNVATLATAPEDEVMAAWAGLGYYSRARNLVACAREVAARGGFPRSEAQLRALPGVGPYTAAAIAAIAFGQRAVVVDANVERVVARLFAITEPLPGARKAIRAATDGITPDDRAGDFAQAMMDLGATICTPRDPRCLLCPLAEECHARERGIAGSLPVKPAKKARPERRGTAWWIERDGHVLVVTRPRTGMLGGMRALPDDGWTARADGSGELPFAGEWHSIGRVSHIFTHCALELEVKAWHGGQTQKRSFDKLRKSGERCPCPGEWVPVDRIFEAGLPTLFAKAARLASAQDVEKDRDQAEHIFRHK